MKNLKIILLSVIFFCFWQSTFAANTIGVDESQSLSVCATGQLTLLLHFDNYPQDLNWQIKNVNNSVFAQGSYYQSSSAGQTVTETIPTLGDGDYALVVFDSGSDGLCCSSGSGYYELLDGTNAVIATGSTYVHSDITPFCYNVTNNDVFDLQAPDDPVISISNITTTTVDVNWPAVYDNVGIWAYGLMIDGVYADLTNLTTYHIWYLQPGTTYTLTLLARDDIGNFSEFSNAVTFTTLTSTPATIDQEVSASYFEIGWDGWEDGGSDCSRYSGSRSAEGSYSIRIRDNSNNKSSMNSPDMDLSAYDSVRVDFEYFHHGYENGENFYFKILENGSYTTVKNYVRGTDFSSNGLYSGSVLLKATDYSFGAANKIRFQSDASNNNDKIYIDAVVVTGYYQGSSARIPQRKSDAQSFFNHGTPIAVVKRENSEALESISLYPNPATDILNFKGISLDEVTDITIHSTSGERTQVHGVQSNGIDISLLSPGVYFISFQDKGANLKSIPFVKN